MTHSHAPRRRTDQPAGRDGCTDCSTPSEPVRRTALPGLAVPAPTGAPVIRRQKADAVRYATDNKIDITVSKQAVLDYVNDKGNDKELRKGLLDAWNLNASSQWVIDTPADLAKASDNPFHYSNFTEYQDFTKSTTGVSVQAFGGPISAFYNQGAPKLGSQAKNWGKSSLGDTYVSYIAGLRSGGKTDAVIARALLDFDDSVLASHLEKRAAAMMTVTVYLAEEWRKQGAAKIYRANLRLIAAGTKTFDDFLTDFEFIGSAQDGRKQVGRFYDVHNGDAELSDMDDGEQQVYNAMSPARDEDFSSEDEMRTEDKKNLKGTRLFAKKHK
ncbi:hypothetical protein [Jatrophihabitans sp.]|uniref:hypothetical protein n=1 Tax=Jatrophihabitans sp. TaxID=1932789 RepID=UPI002CB3FA1C|nr:hypothetical protein [Jatrophihabitans sp.]